MWNLNFKANDVHSYWSCYDVFTNFLEPFKNGKDSTQKKYEKDSTNSFNYSMYGIYWVPLKFI
jgi:hypothetical protein